MGKMLAALLRLQTVERDLSQVRRRLGVRKSAVSIQQGKIDQLRADHNALTEKALTRRKDADRLELDLKVHEDKVARLRAQLNTAKTNKEYAAILTEINTSKADNAKLEEEVLKIMAEVDTLKAQTAEIDEKIKAEDVRLAEVQKNSGEEIDKLTRLTDNLTKDRTAAASEVSPEALLIFERVSQRYEGEAMANVEQHGRRPPFDYICGGCYMSLNAEHANVLRVRDEIRTCDNCKRILYMEPDKTQQARSE